MTLDEAIRLQEKWKATRSGETCQHDQLLEYLRLKNGERTDYKVCLVCGEVYLNPRKPLTPAEFKTLVELFNN